MEEKTIDEVISDLIQWYNEELQIKTNEELEEEYERTSGSKVKIVE